jgi:carbamate kinase
MRIVVALGGNALERAEDRGTYEEQVRNVRTACGEILEIVARGNEVVVTHGNGPQVGNLALQQEKARGDFPPQPLHVLGAMTQGQIGYMIQQALQNIASHKRDSKQVLSVVARLLVSRDDPAFKNPTKPIGPFYDLETSERLKAERGYVIAKVKPEGVRVYRRVVPSPEPIRIIEADAIRRLLDEEGMMIVASGGGGIPVVMNQRGELEGVDAVVDKDLAAEKLAEAVAADELLLLTDIDSVKLNFGTTKEKAVRRLTVFEAKRYLEEGQFLAGSMKPKVQACVRFTEWGGKGATIALLGEAIEALQGRAGTRFVKA